MAKGPSTWTATMARSFLILAFVILIFTKNIEAQADSDYKAFSELDYPNPMKDFAECGTETRSYVCDPGSYLSKDEMGELNTLIRSLQDSETCLCDDRDNCRSVSHHMVMIAIVPRIKFSIGGYPVTSDSELKAARAFAEHLRDSEWKRHDDITCPMQVFIVYDVYTNRLWTSTDYYAFKIVSNDKAAEVAKTAKSDFLNRGEIFSGMKQMVETYKKLLDDGIQGGLKWWGILLIVLGCLTGVGLIICCICCCCGGGGGGGGGGVFSGTPFSDWGSGCGGGGGGGGGCGGGGGD